MNIKFGHEEMVKRYGRMTFARAIKALRMCDEFSQVDYAKKLGITASALADIESGRRIPSPARAAKIARQIEHPIEFWVQLAIEDHIHKEKLPLKIRVEAA